jgi:hypothetical protein
MPDSSFRGGHCTYRLAITAAAAMSSVVLYEAIRHGLTGTYSGFSDEYDPTAMMIIVGVVHGVTYLALPLCPRR